MKLVVHELKDDGVSQVLRATRNVIVEAIRPHIYRHNFAAGSLKVQILDSENTLVAESEAVNISSIGSEDFFHGYVRFYINAYLAKDQDYKFKLVGAGGYSFSEAAYIGWCNGFDLGKYTKTYSNMNSLQEPLDLEVWERKVR